MGINSLLFISFVMFSLSCNTGKQDKKEIVDKTEISANSIPTILNEEPSKVDVGKTNYEYGEEHSFESLLKNVPITKLPFGVMDSMRITMSDRGRLSPTIDYDTINNYALKNYFQENEKLTYSWDPTIDVMLTGGLHNVNYYFSKRLTPLPTGEELLLFYAIDSTRVSNNSRRKRPAKYEYNEEYILFICNPTTGRVSDRMFFITSKWGGYVSYMDKQHIIYQRGLNNSGDSDHLTHKTIKIKKLKNSKRSVFNTY